MSDRRFRKAARSSSQPQEDKAKNRDGEKGPKRSNEPLMPTYDETRRKVRAFLDDPHVLTYK
jgi:hypothetical protein